MNISRFEQLKSTQGLSLPDGVGLAFVMVGADVREITLTAGATTLRITRGDMYGESLRVMVPKAAPKVDQRSVVVRNPEGVCLHSERIDDEHAANRRADRLRSEIEQCGLLNTVEVELTKVEDETALA